jgi:hypothetical protein
MAARISRGVQDFNNETVGGAGRMAQRIASLLGANETEISALPAETQAALRAARQFLGSGQVTEDRLTRLLQDGRIGPVSRLAARIANDQQAIVGNSEEPAQSIFSIWANSAARAYAPTGDHRPELVMGPNHQLHPQANLAAQRHAPRGEAPPAAPRHVPAAAPAS